MSARHRDAYPTYEPEKIFAEASDVMKLIAFYLPQFHPFPENDGWWGKGFTEWHNVVMGRPLYRGHDQPRLPADLGYYDLRLAEIAHQQIAIAKRHGIYGFCLHYYWFGGKILMHMPVERLLADTSLDMPFCLCWANENWTRRWDGEEDDILIGQHHSEEDDLAFIANIAKYFRDPRYIKVEGKPILLVYRAQILPHAKATAQRWRDWCQANGVGEIHLVLVHSFLLTDDPIVYGYDSAVEFPPHMKNLEAISENKETTPDFKGHIYSYSGMAESFMRKPCPDFTLYKCVSPAWDNTARRRNKATVFSDSSPDIYAHWLDCALSYTKEHLPPSRRLVFINAWNEWAEGAYLEPDLRWGYAYLNRTSHCLTKNLLSSLKILVVTHDTNIGGAQILLLSLLEWMRRQPTLDVHTISISGGNIRDRFSAQGPLLILDEEISQNSSPEHVDNIIYDFCNGKPDVVLANTVVTGKLHALATLHNIPVVTFIHEQEQSILRFAGEEIWRLVKNRSCRLLAASSAVFDNLKRRGVPPQQIFIANAYIKPAVSEEDFQRFGPGAPHETRKAYREKLGLPGDGILVFGCGSLDWRKGPDLFFETAISLRTGGHTQFHFIWIGSPSDADSDRMLDAYKKGPHSDAVTFLGLLEKPREMLLAGDIFFLSSREDPFPLAALEGAECGLPILCFADTGGIPPMVIAQHIGAVVPAFSAEAAAQICCKWVNDTTRIALGQAGRTHILSEHTLHRAGPSILHAIKESVDMPPAVSVIVPNYNYGRHLPMRLNSILAQTVQDMEIIILDDASTDDSLSVIERYSNIPFVRVIRNAVNSGSVFAQWKKGLELAKGSIIWVAEADDACTPDFLETLLPAFRDPNIVLATCASKVIDFQDMDMGFDYRDIPYMTQLSPNRWYSDYVCTGQEEVLHGMGSRNTIFNASSVLFRKPSLSALEDSMSYTLSGDWLFYLNILKTGSIAYFAKAMNMHRRHDASVASKIDASFDNLLQEFWRVHSWVIKEYDPPKELREQMVDFMRTIILPMFPHKTEADMHVSYNTEKIISNNA